MAQLSQPGARPRLVLSGGAARLRLGPFEMVTLAVVILLAAFIADRAYERLTGFNKAVAAPPEYVPAIRTTLTSQVATTGTVQATQQVSLNFDIGTGTAKIQQFLVGLG